MKKVKKLFSLFLVVVLLLNANTLVFAHGGKNSSNTPKEKVMKAYENVIDYAYANGIALDLSLDAFAEEYKLSCNKDITEYESSYYNTLKKPTRSLSLFLDGGSKWYYNTGTSLPQTANYSKYNLLNTVRKGDIIFESKGGFGITGHVAIVEGKFYSSARKQYYIRVVEALAEGIVRSVLDDTRIDEKRATVLRVSGASNAIVENATNFCIGQLGKAYMLDFKKNTSSREVDWYCSELVWAGYYNYGINIETKGFYNEPGITPRDINNSSRTYNVNFK